MRRRINLPVLYDKAQVQLKGIEYEGASPLAWPEVCPFTLDELLNQERSILVDRLRQAISDPDGPAS
jgi:hypothetical protein